MSVKRLILCLLFASALAAGHPMGNFSINHYARLRLAGSGSELTYVLDFAELPTFQLMSDWGLTVASPAAEVKLRAERQARLWLRNLVITANGKPVDPLPESASAAVLAGAGGMPVLRVTMTARLAAAPGKWTYEDKNYPERTGWKEIVIDRDPGTSVRRTTQGVADRSHALTTYPTDLLEAPPQDVRARVEWSAAVAHQPRPAPVAAAPAPAQPAPVPTAAPFAAKKAAPGTLVRGDFLSELLERRQIGWGLMLVGIAAAFGLGAMHALSPGHGKTIVAAYLVGSRGTLKHALLLGGLVTFSHTASVFLLGLGVLLFQDYFVPEKLFPILGALSGLSIVGLGAVLLFKRLKTMQHAAAHHHHHHHEHDHPHPHDHPHEHHHGDGHVHSHVPEGNVTIGGLIALGVSGGLVPCPSALVLLLSSIAIGRVTAGLLLLVGFSAGLAVVLMGIGALVLYAKHLLPNAKTAAGHKAFRLVPVLSAAVVICVGLLMTSVALGWIRPQFLV